MKERFCVEQKRFDKKNLLVLIVLAVLIAAVALASTMLKKHVDPTLGTLAADPTQAPAATEAATENPAAAADPAATEVPAAEPAKAYLLVTVAGQMYEPIPLYEEGRYTITRGDMVNTIAVTPTSIRMHESSCDNQDCVLQGEVTLENRDKRVLQHMILCLPNEVILELYTFDELAAMLLEMAGYTGEAANE